MHLETVIQLDKENYMNTFGDRVPVCFERGEGIYLWDTEGRRYVDFFAGIAVSALGHSHPALVKRLTKQVASLLHTSNLYYNSSQALLAAEITSRSCASRVFFANSGAEANEGAIKLAKMYFYKKGECRQKFLSLSDSFHGRTLATVSATGQEKYQKPYLPLAPEFTHIEANNLDSAKSSITEEVCGVFLEVIQGEGGVHPLTDEFLHLVRKKCDETGALLIIDEVQTGMGRTGKLLAHEWSGVKPDIFTLAKALGGGVPIGALCASEKVASAFSPGEHGTTFGGNHLACEAGLAVFEVLYSENLIENSLKTGEYLKSKIPVGGRVKEVRGRGLMIGIELDSPASELRNALFERGYLVGATGNTLRILPPLTLTEEQANEFIDILEEVLNV